MGAPQNMSGTGGAMPRNPHSSLLLANPSLLMSKLIRFCWALTDVWLLSGNNPKEKVNVWLLTGNGPKEKVNMWKGNQLLRDQSLIVRVVTREAIQCL